MYGHMMATTTTAPSAWGARPTKAPTTAPTTPPTTPPTSAPTTVPTTVRTTARTAAPTTAPTIAPTSMQNIPIEDFSSLCALAQAQAQAYFSQRGPYIKGRFSRFTKMEPQLFAYHPEGVMLQLTK